MPLGASVRSFRIDGWLQIRHTYGLESMEDGRGSLEGMVIVWYSWMLRVLMSLKRGWAIFRGFQVAARNRNDGLVFL